MFELFPQESPSGDPIGPCIVWIFGSFLISREGLTIKLYHHKWKLSKVAGIGKVMAELRMPNDGQDDEEPVEVAVHGIMAICILW
jgi:hypothetical protein